MQETMVPSDRINSQSFCTNTYFTEITAYELLQLTFRQGFMTQKSAST